MAVLSYRIICIDKFDCIFLRGIYLEINQLSCLSFTEINAQKKKVADLQKEVEFLQFLFVFALLNF